jgi:hypothetical protein
LIRKIKYTWKNQVGFFQEEDEAVKEDLSFLPEDMDIAIIVGFFVGQPASYVIGFKGFRAARDGKRVKISGLNNQLTSWNKNRIEGKDQWPPFKNRGESDEGVQWSCVEGGGGMLYMWFADLIKMFWDPFFWSFESFWSLKDRTSLGVKFKV